MSVSEAVLRQLSDLRKLVTAKPDLVFGTVTQASPLRVRLDGDSIALPYTPANLVVAALADRVACIKQGTQRLVVGVIGGMGHGGLSGLGADDHTQYHNNTRGDARYAPVAKGVTNGDGHDHVGGDGSQIAHGGLAGLGNNDHTQYSLTSHTHSALVAWPVGSIFQSTVSTSPATLFGGTWVALTDRFLVGQGSGTFATNGATGGAETHALTTAQIPNDASNRFMNPSVLDGGTGNSPTVATSGTRHPYQVARTAAAHNNLPPYKVVFMWERTA